MQLTTRSVIASLVVVAGGLVPAAASAAPVRGVVAHRDARAHSFVVAGPHGRLTAIHARHLPPLGHTVTVVARALRNGTWEAQRVHVGGPATHVRMRGTVTYVNAAGHTFVLSARGASLLVHSKATRRHGVRASSDPGIHDGDVVTVDGDLSGDAVDADSVQISGAQSSQISLEGTVQAVDTTGRTLSVSADDDEQSGAAVTVEVPASFDLGTYTVGEPVELVVSSNPDGKYTLQQSSDDSNASSADSIDDQQGDDHGGAQSGSDQSGSGEAAGTVGGADSEAQSGSGSHSGSDG